MIGFGLVVAFTVPALIGMARHSFWLDETITLFPLPSGHETILEVAANLRKAVGSLAHTPLHTLMAAAWASVCPSSELGLRLINLPILLACAGLGWWWARFCEPGSAQRRWGLIALFATSPFFIYYAYDFRPYIFLVLTGAMMAIGLLILNESPRAALWLIGGGATVAFATQPTVALLVPWLVAIVLWSRRRTLPGLLRQAAWPMFACVVPATVAGWHYVLLLQSGGMTSYGAAPTFNNLAFVFYEFLGLLGIGPTREALRTLAPPPGREATVLIDLRPTSADWLQASTGALIWAIVLMFAARELWKTRGLSDNRASSLWRVDRKSVV